jgi:hypothetical protein
LRKSGCCDNTRIAIFLQKVKKNYPDNHRDVSFGVKGMLPLDCLPLWGREGVTLIVLKQNENGEPGFILRPLLYEILF